MELSYGDGWKLINKARERQNEERKWMQYTAMYPHFTKETFVSWRDFSGKTKKKVKPMKSAAEIYEDVKKMREKYGWM